MAVGNMALEGAGDGAADLLGADSFAGAVVAAGLVAGSVVAAGAFAAHSVLLIPTFTTERPSGLVCLVLCAAFLLRQSRY